MIYTCRNVDRFKKADFERIMRVLPKAAVKYRGTKARIRASAISYALLLYGLKKEYNIVNPEIEYNTNGKPYLKYYPDIHIGISHSGYMSAAVVCDFPVGLDVELVQPVSDNVLRYSCNDTEIQMVLNSNKREEMFCTFWTQKESTIKCQGITFKNGLKNVIDKTRFDYETIIMNEYCLTICKEKESKKPS